MSKHRVINRSPGPLYLCSPPLSTLSSYIHFPSFLARIIPWFFSCCFVDMENGLVKTKVEKPYSLKRSGMDVTLLFRDFIDHGCSCYNFVWQQFYLLLQSHPNFLFSMSHHSALVRLDLSINHSGHRVKGLQCL